MEPAPAARPLPERRPPAVPPAPEIPSATSLAGLFEAEESPLIGYAMALVRRRSVAEDIVQDAFLRLHQVWGQVENPRAWVYRCTRNLALNHLRDHRRETEFPEHEPAAELAVPADTMERNEAVGAMRMLLAELPHEDGELVRLKYAENLKYDEIGKRTGLNPGTVGYRLHHVLKGLAAALRRVGVEGSNG